MDLFANFTEIFWDTKKQNVSIKKLNSIGFLVINNLVSTGYQRNLVYLSKIIY